MAALLVMLVLGSLQLSCGQLRVGGALNVFSRFGYLSISMRVMPRFDDNNWIFREPVVDVFQDVIATKSEPEKSNSFFHGDYYMDFCKDVPELLHAYFQRFTIEKLERPWEAFTASWTEETMARYLGLNSTYLRAPYSYVLIRISRHRDIVRLSDSFSADSNKLHDAVAMQANLIEVGNFTSVAKFVRSYGSHYITSYVTGNSLFQVLVYTPDAYMRLKSEYDEGVQGSNKFFTPQYVEHFGLVLPASGNSEVAQWAKNNLQFGYKAFRNKFTSLLKLRHNTTLFKEVDTLLGNEALLELNLSTLSPAIRNHKTRCWFEEVIDNNLKLWLENMK